MAKRDYVWIIEVKEAEEWRPCGGDFFETKKLAEAELKGKILRIKKGWVVNPKVWRGRLRVQKYQMVQECTHVT